MPLRPLPQGLPRSPLTDVDKSQNFAHQMWGLPWVLSGSRLHCWAGLRARAAGTIGLSDPSKNRANIPPGVLQQGQRGHILRARGPLSRISQRQTDQPTDRCGASPRSCHSGTGREHSSEEVGSAAGGGGRGSALPYQRARKQDKYLTGLSLAGHRCEGTLLITTEVPEGPVRPRQRLAHRKCSAKLTADLSLTSLCPVRTC